MVCVLDVPPNMTTKGVWKLDNPMDRASEGIAMPTLPDNTDKFIDQACHAVFGQFDGGRMGKEVSMKIPRRNRHPHSRSGAV